MTHARAERSPQRSPKPGSSSRLAWVEGIRVLAAIMVLLYHAQLQFTAQESTAGTCTIYSTSVCQNSVSLLDDRLVQLSDSVADRSPDR